MIRNYTFGASMVNLYIEHLIHALKGHDNSHTLSVSFIIVYENTDIYTA